MLFSCILLSTQLSEWSSNVELRSGCSCDQTCPWLLMSLSVRTEACVIRPAVTSLMFCPTALLPDHSAWATHTRCCTLHVPCILLLPLDFCIGYSSAKCYSQTLVWPNPALPSVFCPIVIVQWDHLFKPIIHTPFALILRFSLPWLLALLNVQ